MTDLTWKGREGEGPLRTPRSLTSVRPQRSVLTTGKDEPGSGKGQVIVSRLRSISAAPRSVCRTELTTTTPSDYRKHHWTPRAEHRAGPHKIAVIVIPSQALPEQGSQLGVTFSRGDIWQCLQRHFWLSKHGVRCGSTDILLGRGQGRCSASYNRPTVFPQQSCPTQYVNSASTAEKPRSRGIMMTSLQQEKSFWIP